MLGHAICILQIVSDVRKDTDPPQLSGKTEKGMRQMDSSAPQPLLVAVLCCIMEARNKVLQWTILDKNEDACFRAF